MFRDTVLISWYLALGRGNVYFTMCPQRYLAEPEEEIRMPVLEFQARLYRINSWTILSLPQSVSDQLSSRSMHMVEGRINGHHLIAPLEPDGKGSHWLRVDDELLKASGLIVGDMAQLTLAPAKIWLEPDLPKELTTALAKDQKASQQWQRNTTKAHWEWIRWIRAAKQEVTRKRRIEIALDKLNKGAKRPCCFNSNICSELAVSRNGVLLELDRKV